MSDLSQSPFATACQTYPHLHAFMRLHTMRPLIAQRLREYWMTMLQTAVCSEGEVVYYRGRLALTKERYVEAAIALHDLLIEIVLLNADDKTIQELCLRLIHAPFVPPIGKPSADLSDEEAGIWFDSTVMDMDKQIEEGHLFLIEEVLRLCRSAN